MPRGFAARPCSPYYSRFTSRLGVKSYSSVDPLNSPLLQRNLIRVNSYHSCMQLRRGKSYECYPKSHGEK